MTVFVADIASYQHGLPLSALRPDCVAVEIKCTQGSTYVDPDYAGWLAQSKAAGLLAVAYHYVDGDAPAAQAAWLAQHIGDKSVPVMLDAEKGALGLPHILDVADAMDAAGLNVRLVYLPKWYWESIGSPALSGPFASRHLSLINADYPTSRAGSLAALYPGDGSSLWAGYGGVPVTMLQFTDAAELGGQKVDANAYKGTAAQLAALLGATAATAPPHSVPGGTTPPWPGRQLRLTIPRMTGSDVRTWQTQMIKRGWNLGPDGADGVWGPDTDRVRDLFQQEKHLGPGPCGPITWKAAFTLPIT